MTLLIAGLPEAYLGADSIVESTHPDVVALAAALRSSNQEDEAFAGAAFAWVRDEVAHSWDARDPRVTLTASQVLSERVGLCYAKSHLLVALLRAGGIPAGLCYQRLRDGDGHVLHGLIAVHLRGGWHRQDARGNKPGVEARFSLDGEQLAYIVDADAGEVDYPAVHVSPVKPVVAALGGAEDVLMLCEGGLPTGLEAAES
ncbi:MAG: transglutaminase family protein [Trueperaceae bacterium]|nr:transglutaminase family protein [Trueperaceae bacterium]MCC6309625.1 transglutaminase family protein [Trueperaceae bacterium]MCO5173340.1 transglutaminase family protein [Trueperaceae bacterium]MCW5818368.1 transglutaminase family protein [Trueperaceae bacterium]